MIDDYPYDTGGYGRQVTTSSPHAQKWFDRGLNWMYAAPLDGRTGLVLALAVDPAGRWLASAGDDRQVRVHDPSTGVAPTTIRVALASPWRHPTQKDSQWPATEDRTSSLSSPDGSQPRHGTTGPVPPQSAPTEERRDQDAGNIAPTINAPPNPTQFFGMPRAGHQPAPTSRPRNLGHRHPGPWQSQWRCGGAVWGGATRGAGGLAVRARLSR